MNRIQETLLLWYAFLVLGFFFGAVLSHAPQNPMQMTGLGFFGLSAIFGFLYIAFGAEHHNDKK